MGADEVSTLAQLTAWGIACSLSLRVPSTLLRANNMLAGMYKQAYDGVSFKPFPEPKTHDANWSAHSSTYSEVETLVIEQREIERKKPR